LYRVPEANIPSRGNSFLPGSGVFMDATARKKTLTALRRVEGQVRGVAKMVEDGRYCMDVVTQIEAARAALARVETDLLRQHMSHCVKAAMTSADPAEQGRVIEELIGVFKR